MLTNYQRAVGYEHTVERTMLHQGRAYTFTNKVHLPPDTRACIFWPRNRQPHSWGGRPTPPDDDVIDEIALLDAASAAARHAPTSGRAAASVDDGDIALHDAASEEVNHAPGEDDDAEPHPSASLRAGGPRSNEPPRRGAESRDVDTSAPARCRRQDGAARYVP